jgi:hypothetical protein
MVITQKELQQLEELHYGGIPMDEEVLEQARAACRGLEIVQTGNCADNVVYAQVSGGVSIMVGLAIENVSNRPILLKEARLEMSWPDADFRWLKKPTSKEVREGRGYVLWAFGPYGFDPSVILNHRFGRGCKLYPRESIEGLLIGQGTASVPDEYADRMLIPARIFVFGSGNESYGAWMKLRVSREGQRRWQKSAGGQVSAETGRTMKMIA